MSDIDLQNMKDLITLMIDNDLTELQYENGQLKIELRRGCSSVMERHVMVPQVAAVPQAAGAATGESTSPTAPADENSGLVAIPSPMVGTFYESAEPGAPPFVSLGSKLTQDTTVCLIEAMKVFNEIKAEVSGILEKIAVKNQDAVEYGQPLFYVRPA